MEKDQAWIIFAPIACDQRQITFYLFKNMYLLLIWLGQVLNAAHGISDLCCYIPDLQLQHANSQLWYVGSSSQTRD